MKRLLILASLVTVAVAACLPVRSQDLAAVIGNLSADKASACVIATGTAGGGVVALTPTPSIPVMAYQALFGFARSNEPGSKVTLSGGGCVIEHGMNQSAVTTLPSANQ
jgi:hypothetical protein